MQAQSSDFSEIMPPNNRYVNLNMTSGDLGLVSPKKPRLEDDAVICQSVCGECECVTTKDTIISRLFEKEKKRSKFAAVRLVGPRSSCGFGRVLWFRFQFHLNFTSHQHISIFS